MLTKTIHRAYAGYSDSDEERPLGSYAVLVTAFNLAFGGALVASRGELPNRLPLADLVLIGAATQKLARMLAKDKVTSVLRAPFTEYQESGAPGEVEEKPRGTGMQLAIGELLICPYCLSQWVAATFAFGLVRSPRVTRLVASVFASLTAADFLQMAYKATEERA